MAVSVRWLAGEQFTIHNLSNSGLGFYGSTFGTSVAVGSYQDSTFITDANGTTQGAQVDNVKWQHPNSGKVNSVGPTNLLDIPNYLATLQIQFSSDTAVKTQNAKFRIYDRSNINNDPSGLTCYCASIIHPSFTQTGSLGSGSSSWVNVHGSGSVLTLHTSPGTSGLSPNGVDTSDTLHDFYIAITPTPDSIGSKTQFGAYFETEYY